MAEPLAQVPTPEVPATGRLGFKEAMGIQEPYIQRKIKISGLESEADKDIAEAKQRQAETLATGRAAAGERRVGEERVAYERYGTQTKEKPLPAAFVPTKDTTQDIAALFSLIGVIGMVVGGKGRTNALSAQAAMNGMLEGWQKGRSDLYAKERNEYDRNFRAMVQMHNEFRKELEDALKLARTNYDAGMQAAELSAAKFGSDIVKAQLRKGELVAAYKTVAESQTGVTKALEFDQKAREKEAADYQRELDRRERQADREQREREAERRHKETLARMAKGDTKATQQQFIAQRAVTALRGAASTMESVMQLPADANVGFLPFLSNKEGMMNYVKNAGGRKLSPQEAKAVETLYSGMSRYLATIEASGTATGLVGLANQLEKIYPKAGDSVADVALKIADTRRIATEAVSAMIESGLLPVQQAKAAEEQIKRFEKAVPFTTQDVVNAQFGGKRTLGEATAGAARPLPSFSSEAEAEKANLPKGTRILINGRRAVVE